MTIRLVRVTGAAALVATLAGLSGCVVAPYPGRAYGGDYRGGPAYEADIAVSSLPPPAPYAEVIPVVPFAGAVWLGGYWGWSGGRHQWVPGRWDRPRPGYRWGAPQWTLDRGQWRLRGGGWRRY